MENYGDVIRRVLAEAGESGLSAQKVALHVYNACNSLFGGVTLADVRVHVTGYLQRCSRNPLSPIRRAGKRGTYFLDTQSDGARQLLLDFSDERATDGEPLSDGEQDDARQLSLF